MSSSILLLASLQGLLLSLGLLFKRTKSYLSNVFLSLIVIVLSMELFFYWGGISGYNNSKGAFPFWVFISYLILPPALWLYLKANTASNFRVQKGQLILFLPAMLQVAILFSSRIMPGNGYFHALLQGSEKLSGTWFFITETVPIIWMAFVVLFYLRKVSMQARQNAGVQNAAMKLQLKKMYSLLAFFCVVVFLWALLVIINAPVLKAVEGSLALFIFALAYIAYFRPDFFEISGFIDKTAYSNYNDSTEWKRLSDMFKKDAIFCRSRLTVNELALELKLPARYVSYLINTYAACSFNDFVNTHRVKEVIKRIKDPAEKHKTLVGIAMETGFNSKSAFNQVFRQHTGQVPSDYLSK